MKPDEQLWQENQQLREKLADARRWARVWKRSAKGNRFWYQDAVLDYEEAMRQYDEQQRRACEAERKVEALHQRFAGRPPAMQRSLVFRQCAHPDCDISALVDRDTPEERLCYCVVHASEAR